MDGGALERLSASDVAGGAAARRPTPTGVTGKVCGDTAAKQKDIMQMLVMRRKKLAALNADTSAIIVGTAACGKSTLLRELLGRDDNKEPKETIGVEYTFATRETEMASGLKWELTGEHGRELRDQKTGRDLPAPPSGGRGLKNKKLADALKSKIEFEPIEWEEFGQNDLRPNHFIKVVVGPEQIRSFKKQHNLPDDSVEGGNSIVCFFKPSNKAEKRKDVAHLWEIGGGTAMKSLLEVPLTETTITNATMVIVADLSRPKEVFAGVEFWMDRLRERLRDIDKAYRATAAYKARGAQNKEGPTPSKIEELKERAAKRFGGGGRWPSGEHPDQALVGHTGINVIIVANKWDLFQKKDPQFLRVMSSCLRFLAHYNGASLLYCAKDSPDKLVDSFRKLLNTHLFSDAPVREKKMDPMKPILVPAGSDTYKSIGEPPFRGNAPEMQAIDPLEMWRRVFESWFETCAELPMGPQKLAANSFDKKYAEKAIDEALDKKQIELKQYRDAQKKDDEDSRREKRVGAPKPSSSRKPSVMKSSRSEAENCPPRAAAP